MAQRRGTKPRPPTPDIAGPVRTCVGCRKRESASRLLRIAVSTEGTALMPDPRKLASGRGAWVHHEERCIAAALDRKAFHRALRVAATVSTGAIAEVLSTRCGECAPPMTDENPSGGHEE